MSSIFLFLSCISPIPSLKFFSACFVLFNYCFTYCIQYLDVVDKAGNLAVHFVVFSTVGQRQEAKVLEYGNIMYTNCTVFCIRVQSHRTLILPMRADSAHAFQCGLLPFPQKNNNTPVPSKSIGRIRLHITHIDTRKKRKSTLCHVSFSFSSFRLPFSHCAFSFSGLNCGDFLYIIVVL